MLSDMFDIKNKALKKLFKQQVKKSAFQNLLFSLSVFHSHIESFDVQSSYRIKLLSSYKEMVSVADDNSYSDHLLSCELGDLSCSYLESINKSVRKHTGSCCC